MTLRTLADAPSTRLRVGVQPFVVIQAALLLLLLALPSATATCNHQECQRFCDETGPNYNIQKCDGCCKDKDYGQNGIQDGDVNKRMEAMEAAIKELRLMIGVTIGLLVLLILLVLVVVLLRHPSTKTLKAALPVFFRSNDEGRASIEKPPPPPNKVPTENRNSTVVRIAEYQNNHSPLTKRMQHNGQVVHENAFPLPDNEPRPRQPSESTCPDDSDLSQPHQHNDDLPAGAYVNLALSTSTLHDTTNSTLGAAVSTNTLDTTLASENPTSGSPNIDPPRCYM